MYSPIISSLEGYEIELTAEERDAPSLSQNANIETRTDYSDHTASMGYERGVMVGTPLEPFAPAGAAPLQSRGGMPGGQAIGAQINRPLQWQQHTVNYVTTIRNRFANEPETSRCVSL